MSATAHQDVNVYFTAAGDSIPIYKPAAPVDQYKSPAARVAHRVDQIMHVALLVSFSLASLGVLPLMALFDWWSERREAKHYQSLQSAEPVDTQPVTDWLIQPTVMIGLGVLLLGIVLTFLGLHAGVALIMFSVGFLILKLLNRKSGSFPLPPA
jgi:hypothetical protein